MIIETQFCKAVGEWKTLIKTEVEKYNKHIILLVLSKLKGS